MRAADGGDDPQVVVGVERVGHDRLPVHEERVNWIVLRFPEAEPPDMRSRDVGMPPQAVAFGIGEAVRRGVVVVRHRADDRGAVLRPHGIAPERRAA